jgi:hypothetical protein
VCPLRYCFTAGNRKIKTSEARTDDDVETTVEQWLKKEIVFCRQGIEELIPWHDKCLHIRGGNEVKIIKKCCSNVPGSLPHWKLIF